MADSRAVEWLKRSEAAFEKLSGQFALAQALAEIFYPERATFFTDSLVGDEYYRDIYDGYPVLMRWRLGNALGAMSRGRGREWFKKVARPDWLDDVEAVGKWNEDVTRTTRGMLYEARAQFTPSMGLSDQDYAVFGWSPLKVTANTDNQGLLFRTLHPKAAAPEENSEGAIDVTHERPCYSGRVIGQMFGKRGKLSRAMKKAVEDDPLGEIPIHSCVLPIGDYEPSKKRPAPRGAKFVSLYLDAEKQDVIQEEYFYSFPYIWRRWMRSIVGSPLALSPCAMVALADAHMAQDIRRTLIEAMEFAADPARMISAGAIEGNLDLAPGGDNFIKRGYDYRTGRPIEPVDTGAMPNYALEFSKDSREYMGQCWLTNLLSLPQDRTMTAYEAERLLDQDAREAAPIFEPMEADNALTMGRVYDLGQRWGAYLPPPDALSRRDNGGDWDFETPVTLALRRLRAQQAVQAVDFTTRLAGLEAQFGQTRAFKRVAWDRVQADGMRGIGPNSWLRDDQEVDSDIAQLEGKEQLAEGLQLAGAAQQLGAGMGPNGQPLALPAPTPAGAE